MKLSQETLIEIVEKSSPIHERLSSKFVTAQNTKKNLPYIDSIIEQWCQISSGGDWDHFLKRLAWDNYELNAVRDALHGVRLRENEELPAWVEIICEYLESSHLINADLISEGNRAYEFIYPDDPIAFEEILIPFIVVARKKLAAHIGSAYKLLSDVAHSAIERNLLKKLSDVCTPSLELEFSIFIATKKPKIALVLEETTNKSSRKIYTDFVYLLLESKILEFFQEYPVLARLTGMVTHFWIDSNKDFILRLQADLPLISQIFVHKDRDNESEYIVDINPEISDCHHDGRSVASITFASGLKLIYKPKELGVEQAYFDLLDWLNTRGVSPQFKILKILSRPEYGWVEFVESLLPQDDLDAKRYYQRSGILLCLAYVLGAVDLHDENIITYGEHPVLIDTETLMHPVVRGDDNSDNSLSETRYLVEQELWQSVVNTGLLPRWQFNSVNEGYDATGLGGAIQQTKDYKFLKWKNINTDFMARRVENHKTNIQKEDSSPNNFKFSLDTYSENIVEGFQLMYRFLMDNLHDILAPNGPLISLSCQPLRFIFRATKSYASVLNEVRKPQYMRDGAARSIYLDILSRAVIGRASKPAYWPLLRLEIQALEQMDIPIFYTYSNSDSIVVGSHQLVEHYFTQPSFLLLVSRLKQLNDKNLEQQISLIRGSLYARITSEEHISSSFKDVKLTIDVIEALSLEETIRQATAIALELREQSIGGSDGHATWIAPQYIAESKLFQLQPVGYSLFEGSCGISLFLSALEKLTNGAGFRDLALAALQPLREKLQDKNTSEEIIKTIGVGGAVGGGSIIYALIKIGLFLNDTTLLEDAIKMASFITPSVIADQTKFDVMAGTAGGILGLLSLYKSTLNQDFLNQAILCGHHLLDHRLPSSLGFRAWQTYERKFLTGFSHGASGIAYALLRLYQFSNELAFLNAAKEAICYERSVFIPELGNWPDFRQWIAKDRPVCMCSWCNGASGIGIARIASLSILDSDEIRQEIEIAINTTKEYSRQHIDQLCCGNLGRVEFLFSAGRTLSRSDLVELAMKQATQVVARAKQKGGFAYGSVLTFHPGFFQGASGIGYQLLRLAYPDQLPSVLLWE